MSAAQEILTSYGLDELRPDCHQGPDSLSPPTLLDEWVLQFYKGTLHAALNRYLRGTVPSKEEAPDMLAYLEQRAHLLTQCLRKFSPYTGVAGRIAYLPDEQIERYRRCALEGKAITEPSFLSCSPDNFIRHPRSDSNVFFVIHCKGSAADTRTHKFAEREAIFLPWTRFRVDQVQTGNLNYDAVLGGETHRIDRRHEHYAFKKCGEVTVIEMTDLGPGRRNDRRAVKLLAPEPLLTFSKDQASPLVLPTGSLDSSTIWLESKEDSPLVFESGPGKPGAERFLLPEFNVRPEGHVYDSENGRWVQQRLTYTISDMGRRVTRASDTTSRVNSLTKSSPLHRSKSYHSDTLRFRPSNRPESL